MKTRCLLLVMLVVSASAREAVARKWTDSTGKYAVEADFVDYRDGKVQLKKDGGTVILIPFEKLSHFDQQHVEQLMAKRAMSPNNPNGGNSTKSMPGFNVQNLKILSTKKRPASLSFELDIQPRDCKIAEVWIAIGKPQLGKVMMEVVGKTPPPSGINGASIRDVGTFQMVSFKVNREKSTNDTTVIECEVTITSFEVTKDEAIVSVFFRDSDNKMSNLLTREVSFK